MSVAHYFTIKGVGSAQPPASGSSSESGSGASSSTAAPAVVKKEEKSPALVEARTAMGVAIKAQQELKKRLADAEKAKQDTTALKAEVAANIAEVERLREALAALEGAPAAKADKKAKVAEKPKEVAPKKAAGEQKTTGLSLQAKKNVREFAEWYKQTITKSEMISYYDISGCYILRPWAFNIWEGIQGYMDRAFKTFGVQNCYFPIFVPESYLVKEKDHIEGFAPEVAWVTRAGQSELVEPIAIRPTSETVMYPYFSKWISSHRDLPLKLNQWCNVVRWEFKNPTPFIRTREFLWQEGHTAHATKEEAATEVLQILDVYARTYEEVLCVPVIKGQKTKKEQFAGGLYTTTVEAFVPMTGRGIQAATSHCLGQNFAKMFDITFESTNGTHELAWQNSWGFTTRSIGIMIMIHGDDKGLRLPPRVAPVQVVVVPILFKEEDTKPVVNASVDVAKLLQEAGIRVHVDDRDNYNPGWKYNHWEQKGVPLRLEVGPRDVSSGTVTLVRRDNGAKETIAMSAAVIKVEELLAAIQSGMLEQATAERDRCLRETETWPAFIDALNNRCMAIAPWCRETACEEDIKLASAIDCAKEETIEVDEGGGREVFQTQSSGAKSLCMPFKQPEKGCAGLTCFRCGAPAKVWCVFGRSY